jgi:hypothetical protein
MARWQGRGIRGLLVLAIGPFACDDGGPAPTPEPASASLVERERWEWVEDVDEDAFGAERPETTVCDPILGIGAEMFGGAELVLEINTDFCDYATVRQPSTQPLQPGDRVSIRVWHYALTTPPPAEAHIALAVDGEVVWEERVPSPAAAALVEGEIAIDRDVPAGTELQFHVHNHGANTYDLLSLEVERSDEGRASR